MLGKMVAIGIGLLLVPFPARSLEAQVAPALKIEARLFGSVSGRLSEDVFGDNGPPLGNVIIGEDASTSTLVTVRISASPPLSPDARLRFTAREAGRGPSKKKAGRLLLDSTVAVPTAAVDRPVSYLAFWLARTGCTPIDLRAELIAPGHKATVVAQTIGFLCYE